MTQCEGTIPKKVVLPVGGWGTRFLPFTKAVPKEMLPVGTKPLIHYAVEEALAAGFTQIIFVMQRGKEIIADYFDAHTALEEVLRTQDKPQALAQITQTTLPLGTAHYIRQPNPRGLGHAVLCAKNFLGDEPFGVMLPDDLIVQANTMAQLQKTYKETRTSSVAIMDVPPSQVHKYGIVQGDITDTGMTVTRVVEKPLAHQAPSTWAIVGRYILNAVVLERLERAHHIQEKQGYTAGELQLTHALLGQSDVLMGVPLQGQRFDCGQYEGWFQANTYYHQEVL